MSFFKIYYILGSIILIGIMVWVIVRAIRNRKLPLCLRCKYLTQYKGPYWRYTCEKNWLESRFNKAPKYCKFFEPLIPENKTVTVSHDGSKTVVMTQRNRY